MWSQYLETSTLASNAGPATLRAIGRLGAAAWKIVSQATHASLRRTCRITIKRAGTYSSGSDTAAPIWRKRPPHAVQPQALPVASSAASAAAARCR